MCSEAMRPGAVKDLKLARDDKVSSSIATAAKDSLKRLEQTRGAGWSIDMLVFGTGECGTLVGTSWSSEVSCMW